MTLSLEVTQRVLALVLPTSSSAGAWIPLSISLLWMGHSLVALSSVVPELAIGRDLQFIRINGTLVGGLAGMLLYLLGGLF